jgi:flagellar basal-body rod modification protein FlgD
MKMQSVSANFMLPTILNTLQPSRGTGLKALPARTNSASSATGGNSGTSADGGLGTTFLSLLAQELQNQDPTAPVDPTAMVGQMISLNQLEQLIGINQTLSQDSATAKSGAVKSSVSPQTIATDPSISNNGMGRSVSAANPATSQLPFDPNTMLPFGFANPGALPAPINSSVNPANIDYYNNNNHAIGGK